MDNNEWWHRSSDRKHMCVNIRGALNQIPRNNRKNGWITDDNGNAVTNNEAIDMLLDEISKGRRVIPAGDCDNFDYQTGCKGHGNVIVMYDWAWENGNG